MENIAENTNNVSKRPCIKDLSRFLRDHIPSGQLTGNYDLRNLYKFNSILQEEISSEILHLAKHFSAEIFHYCRSFQHQKNSIYEADKFLFPNLNFKILPKVWLQYSI